MKFPWTIVAVLAANSLAATPKTEASPPDAANEYGYRWSARIEGDVKERLKQLSLPFEARYDPTVRSTIKEYVTNGYRDTEALLGRTSAYFPIFEHYLRIYGLPQELRYLPIVETGLKVRAYSQAGAAGLWQFIPSSARLYGLKMNGYVDERLDPYRSTEAAVRMLSRLHDQYKSWPLVLAAYNCGPVRVNEAIREAGCRDFYTVAEHLPGETQEYVPRFVAAAYIANFYSDHGLKPRYQDAALQNLRAIRITNELTFGEIAHATEVSMKKIEQLNPAYRRAIIPKSRRGHYLSLPASGMNGLKSYLAAKRGATELEQMLLYPNYHKTFYTVRPGESIEVLSQRFRCTVEEIQDWNYLQTPEVVVNQELLFFVPDASLVAKP